MAGAFGWYGRDDRRAARDALAEVGVEDVAGRPYALLSGGQRQRVLIARALCCQPELLLLDEPTASVDTVVEARLAEILRRLSRQMTLVMVSHDLGFVSALVKNVACVNRRVVVHPTDAITGDVIQEMYDASVRVVRHEDILTQPGHSHEGHGHG